MPTDAGIEPRTVATRALAVRRSTTNKLLVSIATQYITFQFRLLFLSDPFLHVSADSLIAQMTRTILLACYTNSGVVFASAIFYNLFRTG